MFWHVAICFIPAFVVSLLTTGIVRHFAPRWGLVDQPGERKIHAAPVPLGGGIGLWLGVLLPVAAAQVVAAVASRAGSTTNWLPAEVAAHVDGVAVRSGRLWAILAAGTLLAAVGLIDDLRELSWKSRLLVQGLLGGAVVATGMQATLFLSLPWVDSALTVLWILVLTNAFNFLDNMDGLSAGIGLIASLLFAVLMLTGTGEPRWQVSWFSLVLAGSCAGFLIHNRPPARIFLGDSGSCLLGFLLACITVTGTFHEHELGPRRHVMLAPLCILAIPLYDFGSVLLIRLREGRSMFVGDTKHFSHRLVELGLSQAGAVLTIHLATLTTCLGALLLYQVSNWTGALIVVALIGCVLAIIAILESFGRQRKRNDE